MTKTCASIYMSDSHTMHEPVKDIGSSAQAAMLRKSCQQITY